MKKRKYSTVKVVLENMEAYLFPVENVAKLQFEGLTARLGIDGGLEWYVESVLFVVDREITPTCEEEDIDEKQWLERFDEYHDISYFVVGDKRIWVKWHPDDTERNRYQKGFYDEEGGQEFYGCIISSKPARFLVKAWSR